jgi:adenylate kinase family enzyme
MNVYEDATRPLKGYYDGQGKLLPIDGSLRIDKVREQIVRKVERLKDDAK